MKNSRQVEAVRFFLITLIFFRSSCCSKIFAFDTWFFFFVPLRFMLDTSCILWILPTGQVSNNPNLLEVFFYVNLLPYLKYTGSFLKTLQKFNGSLKNSLEHIMGRKFGWKRQTVSHPPIFFLNSLIFTQPFEFSRVAKNTSMNWMTQTKMHTLLGG